MRKWMIIFIICLLLGCSTNPGSGFNWLDDLIVNTIDYLLEESEKARIDAEARAKLRKQQAVEQCEMECG